MFRAVCQLWKRQPRCCGLLLLFAVAVGGLTPVTTQYEKELIDQLQALLGGQGGLATTLYPLAVLLGCYAAVYLLPALTPPLYERLRADGEQLLGTQYLNKLQRLEYRFLEDRKTADLIARLAKQCDGIAGGFLQNLFALLEAMVSVLGFFVLICRSSWVSALVFLGLFWLLLALADRAAKSMYALEQHFSETERRVTYLDGIVNGRPSAHEKKLFGFTGYVGQKRADYLLGQRRAMRRYDRRFGFTFSLIDTAGYLCTLLMMLSLLPAVRGGRVSLGVFIAVSHAAIRLNLTTQTKLRRCLNQLMEHRRFWREYWQLLALPEQPLTATADGEAPGALPEQAQKAAPAQPAAPATAAAQPATAQPAAAFVQTSVPAQPAAPFVSIEFRDVGFRYREDRPWVLRHLDLRMEQGRHYALVGENGCGKSTLVKLLLRLYDAQEGVILLNGRDIRQWTTDGLRQIYAAVFQDFSRYYLSLADNITFGDRGQPQRLQTALRLAHADDIATRVGADTLLGDIYPGGRDLSGGEWQRVAFARALYHGGPVLLLDEPTAALDPVSENEIYTQFGRLAAHKTTLFITHRLASTQMADEIWVLADGRLRECGSHAQLLAADGLYARMYDSQRKWYTGGDRHENE